MALIIGIVGALCVIGGFTVVAIGALNQDNGLSHLGYAVVAAGIVMLWIMSSHDNATINLPAREKLRKP